MRHGIEQPERLYGGGLRPFYSLFGGFLLIIGLMTLLAVFSVTRMEAMHANVESILEWHNVRVAYAYHMRVVVRDRMIAMNRMVMDDDAISREEAYSHYLELAALFMGSRDKVANMTQDEVEREQLKNLQRLAAVVTPLNDRVVDLARNGRQAEAKNLLLQEALPAQQRVLEQIDGVLDKYREAANKVESSAHRELERTIKLLWLLAIIVLVLSGFIAAYTINRARRDRKALIEAHDMGARLHYMAHHDPLSGLFNRVGMSEQLQTALMNADRDGTLVAALLLDLDGFKAINDTYGHEAGDQLLISVAQRLASCVHRNADSVSRLAGDEFVILLCELEVGEGASIVAERILKRLGQPHRVAGHELRVMASIGIAVYPADADSSSALLHCADLAMYRAKQMGKSGYCYYHSISDGDANRLA